MSRIIRFFLKGVGNVLLCVSNGGNALPRVEKKGFQKDARKLRMDAIRSMRSFRNRVERAQNAQ